MKNKLKLVVLSLTIIALVAVGLSSCSTPSAQNAPPVNISLNNQQGLWVNGQGVVTVTPDIAVVSLGVSSRASKVAEAQSAATTAMNKVMSTLTSNGIDKKDIQTQNFSIQQTTRYDNNTQQSVVTGFLVSNTVTVKIRNISKTGDIIDAVAAAGGDFTRVNNINFSVDKPEQYYAQARQLAMADAKNNAEQLAKLAGETLGKATYITENVASQPVPYRLAAPAAADSSTPVSPGETNITLNVQVVYSIQ